MILTRPLNANATGALIATGGRLYSVTLKGGSGNSALTIHDNASAASGVVVVDINALANDTTVVEVQGVFANGLYATLSGTGATVTAYIF